MDTATHFAIGFGLAGLAYIDPVVAADPVTAGAIMLATVLGSQAPDFDTVLRMRGNAAYIRNHRGLSHSLPFLAIWTFLITALIMLLFREAAIWHVALWTGIAVCLHVFTDLFNTYGTQALRPLSHKWISWDIIHIFDPFIFGSHVVAIALWALQLLPPAPLFTALYGLLIFYYMWRVWSHRQGRQRVQQLDPGYMEGDTYSLIPTMSWSKWHVVKAARNGSYELGVYENGKLMWSRHAKSSTHAAVEASTLHNDIRSFLYFSSYAVADVEEFAWGYIVRWTDVRYRHRKQYPFVAVIAMDRNFETLHTYVGWLSDEKMQKRLSPHMN